MMFTTAPNPNPDLAPNPTSPNRSKVLSQLNTGIVGLLLMGTAFVAPAQAQAPYGPIDGLTLTRPDDKIDAPSTPPPPGAIALFDGKSLDQWVHVNGKDPAPWKLLPGGIMQVEKGGIKSRKTFDGKFLLHVEFRVPYMPDQKGQARGNSGVYLQGRYEVQVLDSYGLDSKDNDCGGIYEVAKPLVNACKAPTVWQSYDIMFTSPVFEGGKKTAPAQITVKQNGVTIHKNLVIPVDNTRAGLGGDPATPGPIHLQDHGNPVQYRNIWALPINNAPSGKPEH